MNSSPKVITLALAALALGACTVQGRTGAYVEPVSAVEVTSAPVVEYRSSPNTVYEGRTVYYVNHRWGYPEGNRWVSYRNEPPPLTRYRTTVDTAPPAPRTYRSPAPEYRSPPPTSAPPATRSR